MNGGTTDEFYDNMAKQAVAEVSCSSDHMTVRFIADRSCIYQADTIDSLTTCVRGIAKVRLSVKPADLTCEETLLLCKLGFAQLYQNVDMHTLARKSANSWAPAATT